MILENHTVGAMVVLSRKESPAAYEKIDPGVASKGIPVVVCPKSAATQLRALYDMSAQSFEKREAHMSVGSRQKCDEPEEKKNGQTLTIAPV